MQRERNTKIGARQDARTTRYEMAECECGHEYVRPTDRPNLLPCGKCGGSKWSLSPLTAGTRRAVGATR